MQRIIFIPIMQGVEAKNVLRTDVFKYLNELGWRIIFFVNSVQKADYYGAEFGCKENIIFEVLPAYEYSPLNQFFSFLKNKLINSASWRLKRDLEYEFSMISAWFYYSRKFILFIFARPFFRKICRFLDFLLVSDKNYLYLFQKYKPDLVFLGNLFDDTEVSFLRQAKKLGIKSVGLINSWDKLTCREEIRIKPEKLIVHNELIKEEAMQYAEMKERDVEVVGVPHFDFYFKEPRNPQELFCKNIGCQIKDNLIVYAPMGRRFSNSDRDIILLLKELIIQLNAEKNLNLRLLVRLRPNDDLELKQFIDEKNILSDFPGKRFKKSDIGLDWDMSHEDLERLADTLYWCKLLVCYASTMSIDAAIFNKPVININFEMQGRGAGIAKLPTRYYAMDHYAKLLAAGGIRMVNSPQELKKAILEYLENPKRDEEGRKKIVAQQCWLTDGNSGKRTVEFLDKFLSG